MKTSIHTRNKEYRNLYRAIPIANKLASQILWERKTRKLVDDAHAAFWARRKVKAPWVSKDTVGVFDSLEKEDELE